MPNSTLAQFTLANNVEQQVAGPNLRRTRIRFFVSTNTTLFIRPDAQGNTSGGMVANFSSGGIEISREQHGDMVTGAWFAFMTVGAPIAVLETVD